MVLEALSILLLLSVTIILGYVGSLIFERTKIPDVIWLMLLGLLLGPVFHLFPIDVFTGISSLMAALALIIILYDAGLNMDFYDMIKEVPRGTLLAVMNVAIAALFVAFISMFLFKFSLMQGLLMGVLLGGTSSEIIIVTMRGLNVRPNVRMLIDLESVLNDPFTIVTSLALIQMMISGAAFETTINGILGAFSIAIVVGSIAGMIWLGILDKLKGRPFDYMLTLAMIFVLYVFTEYVHGSGALSVLAFGIVLGNAKTFSEMFRMNKVFTVDELLKKFNSEITFAIRSFFFVYMGLIATINPEYALYGLAISSILILARYIATNIGLLKSSLSGFESNITSVMGPRGLATAVLSQLPLIFGLPGAEIYSNIAFIVILSTVIYTAAMTSFLSKRAGKHVQEVQLAPVVQPPVSEKKKPIRSKPKK